jgi:hypothetical protein
MALEPNRPLLQPRKDDRRGSGTFGSRNPFICGSFAGMRSRRTALVSRWGDTGGARNYLIKWKLASEEGLIPLPKTGYLARDIKPKVDRPKFGYKFCFHLDFTLSRYIFFTIRLIQYRPNCV